MENGRKAGLCSSCTSYAAGSFSDSIDTAEAYPDCSNLSPFSAKELWLLWTR
jgi:hypothetical protein